METLQTAQQRLSQRLTSYLEKSEEGSLYAPIHYLLSLGGKRIRPALVLLACDLFEGNVDSSVAPALGIELFHNFTLMHDDIMDKAPLRRGKATVHEKWDANQAILSGDAMLVQANRLMCEAPPEVLGSVLTRFNQVALEVCEGQQLDMEFESRDDVSKEEYLEMIRLKTSVLLAEALRIGAILARASDEEQQKIYDFGINVGLSFQLLDDYLDAFGDAASFGKQVGGDILSDKKTYLNLIARERASAAQIAAWEGASKEQKVATVLDIYRSTGSGESVLEVAEVYHQKALANLESIAVDAQRKAELHSLAERLLARQN